MPTKIFSFCTNYLTKPLADMRVIYIVIIYPAFVASIIRRIYVDTINLPFILWQQGFQCLKVVPMNNLVATMSFGGVGRIIAPIPIFMFQHTERHFRMMIDYLIFSYPV